MTDSVQKVPHKVWRKAAKKSRRKRIRQHLAILRKAQEKEKESSPTYQLQLEKKRLYEEYELEKEEKEREERNLKWLQEEEQAQRLWREQQKLKQLAHEDKLKEQEKIRKEWEKEQLKIKEQKEKLEALKREEERRKQEVLDKINDFMTNGGDVPFELRTITESNPGKELCSFYQKVGACRFGNQCSRNHHFYKISNSLMIVNFYSHFTLEQSKTSEYDTDIRLEYEDSDMYSHFKEFYNDVVPEFKKFGDVTMVKVCCNSEFHLRGNVYVEYKNEREALVAYKSFQGRWYGGKQLNVEFVKINDWGSAVCGDYLRHRCPKGNSCNFLHVFKNPKNEFFIDWNKSSKNSVRDSFDDGSERRGREWRWSETPEPSPVRNNSCEKYANGRRKRNRIQSSDRRRSRSKSRSSKRRRSKNSGRKKISESESSRSEKRQRSHSSERKSKRK